MPHPRTPSTPARPPGPLAFDWAVVEQVRPEVDSPDASWRDVLARIACPTLVIAGGPRSHVPQHHLTELVDRLPRARMVTIDAGHLVHRTRPEELIDRVTEFLDADPG